MKKSLFLFLMLFTAFFCFAAGQQDNDAAAEKQLAPGPFGKYETPITVEFVGTMNDSMQKNVIRYDNSFEDNMWTRIYAERLGIQIEYQWIAKNQEEYNQKLNVSLASGDIPDILGIGLSNLTQFKRLYDAELIAPLTDIYEEYISPRVKQELMSFLGDEAWSSVTFDGEKYGIPIVWARDGEDATCFTWIREDWLENLGLKPPTTAAELIQVAEAFTNADPDGNGENDTYGFLLKRNLWGSVAGLEHFFNSFHAYPTIWIDDGEGGLAYGTIQPEVKETLQVLQDLFKRGIIDSEFGVRPDDKIPEEVAAERVGIVFGPQWISLWPLPDNVNANPEADWLPLMLVSADDKEARPQGKVGHTGVYVVNKEFQYPEVLPKMANLYHELYIDKYEEYGNVPGETPWEVWKFSPIGFAIPGKNQATQKAITEAYIKGNADDLVGEQKAMFDNVDSYLTTGNREDWGWYRIFGPGKPGEISQAGLADYLDNNKFVIDKFVGAPTDTMTAKFTTLESLRDEVFVKIIVGDYDIDQFDKFVSDWNNLGGADITAEVNAWYSSTK